MLAPTPFRCLDNEVTLMFTFVFVLPQELAFGCRNHKFLLLNSNPSTENKQLIFCSLLIGSNEFTEYYGNISGWCSIPYTLTKSVSYFLTEVSKLACYAVTVLNFPSV